MRTTTDHQPPEESGDDGRAAIREFGHFKLLKELGRGAQGVVYLAEDMNLRRKVALKMLAGASIQSEQTRDRFQREAEITSKLDHPGICGVHEVGEAEGIPYIAMQYLRGKPLSDLIAESRLDRDEAETIVHGERAANSRASSTSVSLYGHAEVRDAVQLIEKVARALHAAHEAGLVHRDIKPGNVMVSPEGEPVLLDFGLARDLDSEGQTLTASGQIMGTPAYLAPEQIKAVREEIDRRTDVYALGVMLYECLTLVRPFEAPTWDKLFHQILNDEPKNPSSINSRIPRDLRTVIEVAMERDPARRYQTALAFADDLHRVRRYEPILAKAAGPILRARKWARRHPATAMAIAAVVLVGFVWGGWATYDSIQLQRAVEGRLTEATAALAEGRYDEAIDAVTWVRAQDPSSVRAVELRVEIEHARDAARLAAAEQESLAEAASARSEAMARLDEYGALQAAHDELEERLRHERRDIASSWAPAAVRGAFAARQDELERQGIRAEQALQAAHEALQRAVRLEARWNDQGEPTAATQAALADFYYRRWQRAIARADVRNEAWLREAVIKHDSERRYAAKLLGRGTLAVAVEPADAALYLFRYESYVTARAEAPVPRLVPVPTTGVGRVHDGEWVPGFSPGDPCLVVEAVEPDSHAARAGLRAGDLIIALNGQPCGQGLFVTETASTPLAATAVAVLTKVESINRVPVTARFELLTAPSPDDGVDRLRFCDVDLEVPCPRASLRAADPVSILAGPMPAAGELSCLVDGELVVVEVPAGATAGVRCRVTAYPLICAADNRVAAGERRVADPGSYLVVARRDGRETMHYPFVVTRDGEAAPELSMLAAGSTPDGFVYVPPGPVTLGGDPDAFDPRPAEVEQVAGFFIAERELTNEQWFEFVNDPVSLERIAASQMRELIPRESIGPIADQRPEGGYTWKSTATPATPVLGISWDDVQGYLAWRNARAEAAGEPWQYDLPTAAEWERAARGSDGRAFPWGDRFDFALTLGLHSAERRLLRTLPDAPGGLRPFDVSPFGVYDMCGSRREWLRETVPGMSPTAAYTRGGSWSQGTEVAFRAAGRFFANAAVTGGDIGARLVVRRRP